MDVQYIRDTYYRAGNSALPRWMQGTRFEKLYILDKWLDGSFYEAINLSFDEEQINGTYNPLRTRRPATKDHLAMQVAGLTARKLFGGRHIPRIKHDDLDFKANVQALIEELKLPVKMLEAAKRGSVGSVLILFKFLTDKQREQTEDEIAQGIDAPTSVKGVVEVKQTQYCTPVFNEFEELIGVMEHYITKGSELIQRQLTTDRDGDSILPNDDYWFIKMIDTKQECTFIPIKKRKWNPVSGSADYTEALIDYPKEGNPFIHNMGFVQGVWIKNLTGGKHPEGLGTWEFALDNWLTLDYQKSQNDRGLKYGSAPQLVIKGDLRDEVNDDSTHQIVRSPSYEIRVAADEKGMDGQSASTGHDAKLLETNGAASKASDEFVRNLKHSTFEQICAARKDLESIKGSMSGKAIELIDEDFLDLVQELLLLYCTYGYLLLLKKLCKSAKIAGHPLMIDADERKIDGLSLDYPPMYLPTPQEVQFLADALVLLTTPQQLTSNNADGSQSVQTTPPILTPDIAKSIISKQLDLVEESANKPVINDTQVDDVKPPDPVPNEETETGNAGGTIESGFMDELSASRHDMIGRNK